MNKNNMIYVNFQHFIKTISFYIICPPFPFLKEAKQFQNKHCLPVDQI